MTTIPETYRAFRRTTGTGTTDSPLKVYATTEKTLPSGHLGPHELLLKIHAVSLN
ncbi:hypothetical protein QBC39DRAFT_372367 [Podospora conica]|nr:hypothetical protein QBC39DRAFT_372367 [Schizothecium conicum]